MKNEETRFERDGFLIIPNLISRSDCDALAAELTPLFDAQQGSSRTRIGGVRNLLQTSPLVRDTARCSEVQALLRRTLGVEAFPVRAIFFDKTPAANWTVVWHQDLHIAVAQRTGAPGFGPWSVKAGVPHVQPPVALLQRMVTVRLHLDDCGADNGALRVMPGSHAAGVLTDAALAEWQQRQPVVCEVPRGGALLMRPLLLHASSSAVNPRHRRVLHLEYAIDELPNGLKWFER